MSSMHTVLGLLFVVVVTSGCVSAEDVFESGDEPESLEASGLEKTHFPEEGVVCFERVESHLAPVEGVSQGLSCLPEEDLN